MNLDHALDELAVRNGVIPHFHDLEGRLQPTSVDTKRALLFANGVNIDSGGMVHQALEEMIAADARRNLPPEIICIAGQDLELAIHKSVTWRLLPEGKEENAVEGKTDNLIVIQDLPSGIHELHLDSSNHRDIVLLISAPEKAPSVFEKSGLERIWGVNLALYGLNKGDDPGIGNYKDLADVASAIGLNGGGFLGVNPVHAMGWNNPEVFSPYSPSHRGFLNTSHIAVEHIEPMSERTRALLASWKHAAQNKSSQLVDYPGHSKFQWLILDALFKDFTKHATTVQENEFAKFCINEGSAAHRVAQYDCLGEKHGSDWRKWSSSLRDGIDAPDTSDERVRFHLWLQWHAENQLQTAQLEAVSSGMGLGLYLDLAVGARQNGAEAWAEAEAIAQDVSIGAPPDHLSPAGQKWDLAAYSPKKLSTSNYRAFREILSRNMRRCGVLRIDHILGLNRSFWIPENGAPGGYIKHNFETLLAIVRLEAERNQTVVIGEDLGLVPEGFRETLLNSGIYSYSVLQYEKSESGKFKNPSSLSPQSLTCFGTHDTPTLRGFATGGDITWWQKLNWIDESHAATIKDSRKQEVADLMGLAPSAPQEAHATASEIDKLNSSVHRAMANSPVTMVSVQFDDIEGNIDAQNLPGTIDEHPNWRRLYSTPIAAINDHPNLKHISKIMAIGGRVGSKKVNKERNS
jgi:4-alpha-glucanotransferase